MMYIEISIGGAIMDIYVVKRHGREYYYGVVYDDTDYSWKKIDLHSDVVRYESYKYPSDIEKEFESDLKKGYIDDYYKVF